MWTPDPGGGPLLRFLVFLTIAAIVEIAVPLGRRSARGKSPEQEREPKKKGIVRPQCGEHLGKSMLFCCRCGRSVA